MHQRPHAIRILLPSCSSGGFGLFLGKIPGDTIVHQGMPNDFRGRAFSLFDIAYNVGWMMPVLVRRASLSFGDVLIIL